MIKISTLVSFALFLIVAPVNAQLIELEENIGQQESKFKDIVKGTEKQIRWHNGVKQKTPYSLVYLHGFSASRQELSPTTEVLADKIGANAFYTRLTGHGRSGQAMTEASVKAWKEDTLEAYEVGRQIGDQVILISASTGGTLATWLQSQESTTKLAANIMVSPNFGVNSSAASILLWPGGLTFAKWINGDERSFTPSNELHALYWTERYPLEAVVPMLELVEEVTELDKSKISIPQLFIYSPQDQVVDVERIEETIEEFKTSRVTAFKFTSSSDPAQHVLSGDACAPESTQDMVNIMESYITKGFKD